jgi:tetratricopeptide (TPR) repeat protein
VRIDRILRKTRDFYSAYRWWTLSGVAVVLVGAIAALAYVGQQKWKLRQSSKLVLDAEEYLLERQATEALMAYETALRLNPKNAEALRGIAVLQYSIGQKGNALLNFQQLADNGAMTPRDAQVFALLAAMHGEWELANRIVDALSGGTSAALSHLVSADISSMRGKMDSAESSLRRAVEIDDSDRCRAALAGFLIANRLDKNSATEIFLLLNELSASDSGLGAAALTSGIEKNLVPPELMPGWIAALRAHPEKTQKMLLVADAVEVKLAPERIAEISSGVVDRLSEGSLEDRKKGVFWLVNHGMHRHAANLVTREEALGNDELFGIWLDALSGASRFDDLHEALNDAQNPLSPWQTSLARGRALKIEGCESEAVQAFEDSITQSSGSPDDLVKVVAYFVHAGEIELMRQGVVEVFSKKATAVENFHVLRKVICSKGDIALVLEFHRLGLESGNLDFQHELQNEIDYCRLVLGDSLEGTDIAQLARKNPYNLRFRVTNALWLFLNVESTKGAAALIVPGEMPHDPELTARHQALSLVAQAMKMESGGEEGELEKIPPQLLSVQERNLVRKLILDVRRNP